MKIAIVGICGSGKSTLEAGLRKHGYKAYAVAQEHSSLPDLWRHRDPDLLIFLDCSFATARKRARTNLRRSILAKERARLRGARLKADIYIRTDGLSPEELTHRAIAILNSMKDGSKYEGKRSTRLFKTGGPGRCEK